MDKDDIEEMMTLLQRWMDTVPLSSDGLRMLGNHRDKHPYWATRVWLNDHADSPLLTTLQSREAESETE